ncbi:MAG: copper homeostasis periplasmic binding protein CopC [Devosia sp.]
MNRLLIALASAALLSAGPAFAHANIVAAVPADKSSGPAPQSLELTFTEGLNLAFSGAKLLDADGTAIELGKPTAIGDGAGMTLAVDTPLAPGDYQVEWNVLSVDGHKLNGAYVFTVVK